MIKQEIINNELEKEGIDKNLAVGISFETEDLLHNWIKSIKPIIEHKTPALTDLTTDELRKLADTGEAKNLQAFADKIRTETLKKNVPMPPDPTTPPADPNKNNIIPKEVTDLFNQMKTKMENLEKDYSSLKEKEKISSRDALIDKYAEGFKPEMLDLLKKAIKPDALEDDIKKEVDKQKAWMTLENVKGLKVAASSSPLKDGVDTDTTKAVEDILKEEAEHSKK